MEISIALSPSEFIVSSIIGPVIASFYFGIKFYLNKEKKN